MPRKITTSTKKSEDANMMQTQTAEVSKDFQNSSQQMSSPARRLKQTAKPIQDTRKRINALWKRKKGLIKKSYFLSRTCAQNVMLAIYDPKLKRLTQFQTSAQFTPQYLQELIEVTATRVKHVTVEDVSKNMIENGDEKFSDVEDCQNPAFLSNQDQESNLKYESPKPRLQNCIPDSMRKAPLQSMQDAQSQPVSPVRQNNPMNMKDLTPFTPTKFNHNQYDQSIMLNTESARPKGYEQATFNENEENEQPNEYTIISPFRHKTPAVDQQQDQNYISRDMMFVSAAKDQKLASPKFDRNNEGMMQVAITSDKVQDNHYNRYLSSHCMPDVKPQQLFTRSTNLDNDSGDEDNENMVKMTSANGSSVMPKPFKVPGRQKQTDTAANFAFQSVVMMPDMFFNEQNEGMNSQIFLPQNAQQTFELPSAQSNKYRSAILMTTPQAAKDMILDSHMNVPQVSNIFDNDASVCMSNVSPLNVSKYQQQQTNNRPSNFY